MKAYRDAVRKLKAADEALDALAEAVNEIEDEDARAGAADELCEAARFVEDALRKLDDVEDYL